MQSEDQAYFLINHKLTHVLCFIQACKKSHHISPQNRFTLKEFETTTREIGFTIFYNRLKSLGLRTFFIWQFFLI